MALSIEQLKVLEALHQRGSVTAAGKFLHKTHTAIIYAMKNMEDDLGAKIFDRSGYRTRLTPLGQRILEEGGKILSAERKFYEAISEIQSGYEPFLKVVVDGAFPVRPILETWQEFKQLKIPSKIQIISDYLRGVEDSFFRMGAQLFIAVVPCEDRSLVSEKLCALKTVLVVSKAHPLARSGHNNCLSDLQKHTFLTVRGSDLRLNLGTRDFEEMSQFHLSDFAAKKEALLAGLGFGWMPEHMIRNELKSGKLRVVRWSEAAQRTINCILCYSQNTHLGPAAQAFVKGLRTHLKTL